MTTATMRPRPVSKKRPAGEPSKPSDPITVKLNRELMRKAEAVASFRGVSRQDYLEALMRSSRPTTGPFSEKSPAATPPRKFLFVFHTSSLQRREGQHRN
jgi:hypothetical protein